MAILPLIGTALASAAVSGIAVNAIKNNSLEKCGEYGSIANGHCVNCLGHSNSRTNTGVEANVPGCRCPEGLGWDPSSNRCVLCPKGTSSVLFGGGGKSNVRGCSCEDNYRFDTKTGTCIACPTGSDGGSTLGNPNSMAPTNTEGCYCEFGSVWDGGKCVDCINDIGSKGVKNGACVNCPTNSNTYNLYGDKTDVLGCNCDNGYIYKNGACTKCPDGYITSYGKCCPAGSSQLGSGASVGDGCYCLPYHTLTNGKCVFENGTPYNISAILPHGAVLTFTLDTPEAIPAVIPSSASGRTGISVLTITPMLTSDILFIKSLVIEYTTPATMPVVIPYISPRISDLYGDDNNSINHIIAADGSINPTWIIKRITIDMINIPTKKSALSYITLILFGFGSGSTTEPTYKSSISLKLPSYESHRKVAINIS